MTIYRDIATLADLERVYSPSSCVDDMHAIVARYTERSVQVRADRLDMQSLAYGADADETLDFFPAPGADDGRPRPVAVFIHGGYWQALGKRDHSFPAPGFAEQGMHYIAVNYGLAPATPFPRLIERCRLAIGWIADHAAALGIDADRVHVSGSSAGAHLAAMAALADWPARGQSRHPMRTLTLLSGVFDLRPIPLTYVNGALGLTDEDALLHSPLLRLDAGAAAAALPPVLVAVGEHETSEFHRQSAGFAAGVQRRGVPCTLATVASRNHFDIVFDLADAHTTLGAAVAAHMRGTSSTGAGPERNVATSVTVATRTTGVEATSKMVGATPRSLHVEPGGRRQAQPSEPS